MSGSERCRTTAWLGARSKRCGPQAILVQLRARCLAALWRLDTSTSSLGELHRRRVRHHLGLGHALEGELAFLTLPVGVDHDDLAGLDLTEQDLLRQLVLDLALDGPAQRPGAEHRV